MSSSSLTPVPETVSLSEPARIIDTFIAPRKTFTDLRRNASWWGPFLIFVIVGIMYGYSVDSKVGFEKVVENQIEQSPRISRQMEQMPPDQREGQIAARAKGTRFILYAFPIVTLIIYAILAGLYLATFKFGAGADLNYKHAFALLMYAALPEVFRALLAALSLFAGANADSFNLQNPIATNPAYFLDPANWHFLYGIASAFDIFRLWTLVLTAIGFTCITKVKMGTSFAIVFGWFIVLTVAFAALGAMGS